MYTIKWWWETGFLALAAVAGYIGVELAKQDATQWKIWLPVLGAGAIRIAIALVLSRITPTGA